MLRLQTPWYQQSYICTLHRCKIVEDQEANQGTMHFEIRQTMLIRFSKSLGSLLARLGRESQDFQGWKLFGMVGFEDGIICD